MCSASIFARAAPVVAVIPPLMLVSDIDAGRHLSFYVAKFIISVILAMLLLMFFYTTSRIGNSAPLFVYVCPVLLLLFVASCTRRRSIMSVGTENATKMYAGSDLVFLEKRVREEPYADYTNKTIHTPITTASLRGAWVQQGSGRT
eukprot:gb/GEZJ01003847.1/.p1 GENE.gb/GEZJ01003847.1/~~gb/GEZJ01003847.1/.p1  ORF type:complete len:146 (+),score=12.61 gb/GEZJ01003847.1/:2753-3190(+)